jgi:hypothetical protein
MCHFKRFRSLSILYSNTVNVDTANVKRPQPNMLNEKEFRRETDRWMNAARMVATAVPSADLLGWHGGHYLVVRRDRPNTHHSRILRNYVPSTRPRTFILTRTLTRQAIRTLPTPMDIEAQGKGRWVNALKWMTRKSSGRNSRPVADWIRVSEWTWKGRMGVGWRGYVFPVTMSWLGEMIRDLCSELFGRSDFVSIYRVTGRWFLVLSVWTR